MVKGSTYSHKYRTGDRYGRLVIVGLEPHARALCRCDCGVVKSVRRDALGSGDTKSCGCLQAEGPKSPIHRTHGMRHTREYGIWCKMKQRCGNPHDPEFAAYGARGIRVCDRWRDSFETFYADMGARPTVMHSIDRIDNDRGYEPSNCRWATKVEQANNRRPRRGRGYWRQDGHYLARIKRNGRGYFLGSFKSEIEAQDAVQRFREQYDGEDAAHAVLQ